jgi:hypothetical protein
MRNRRDGFNLIASTSKILFSALSSEDTDHYQSKIMEFHSEQLSMLEVAKEQVTVVRSALQTVNSTLADNETNELKISGNLISMKTQINVNVHKTNETFSKTELFAATDHHMTIIEYLTGQLREKYDTLLFEISSLQIISPGDIIRALQNSHSTK